MVEKYLTGIASCEFAWMLKLQYAATGFFYFNKEKKDSRITRKINNPLLTHWGITFSLSVCLSVVGFLFLIVILSNEANGIKSGVFFFPCTFFFYDRSLILHAIIIYSFRHACRLGLLTYSTSFVLKPERRKKGLALRRHVCNWERPRNNRNECIIFVE